MTHAFPLLLDLTRQCAARGAEGPSVVTLNVDLHHLVARSNISAAAADSLLLPSTPACAFGVLASAWDAAILACFAQLYPQLNNKLLRSRARSLGFMTLASRVVQTMRDCAHIFGHPVVLASLFPHVSAGASSPPVKRLAVHTANLLGAAELNYLRHECLLPLHLIFFFLWLAHPHRALPARQVQKERARLENMRLAEFHRLGTHFDNLSPTTADDLPPTLAAINAMQMKLDALLVSLNDWQEMEGRRARVETQTTIEELTRVVQQLVKHVASPAIDTASLDALLAEGASKTTPRAKRKRQKKVEEDEEEEDGARKVDSPPLDTLSLYSLASSNDGNEESIDVLALLQDGY